LSEKFDSASLSAQVSLSEATTDSTKLRLEISQNGEVVYSTTTSISAGEMSLTITAHIANPKLWWPHGHGEHPIYTARASILSQDDKAIDEKQTKFGIRTIEVVQRPLIDAPGKTFMFQVNNRSIFIQGADWIPSDNLAPTMTRERYFSWIRMAQKSNVNMIRVWGGGYYETEDFWDACDEHGIMIWQDYMLACGDYPINAPFLESMRKEAELQTIRFRNRASLALLCGGNEDFMFADWAGPYDHDDMKGPFDDTSFPQRKIYLDVLLNVAREFAPHIQYWANSPWGGPTANDETIGDVHQWDGMYLLDHWY
jgi:beta-mannosidase